MERDWARREVARWISCGGRKVIVGRSVERESSMGVGAILRGFLGGRGGDVIEM